MPEPLRSNTAISGDALGHVIRSPVVWFEAIRAAAALAPRLWWRRRPFLPIPDVAYVAWRAETAYGRADAAVTGEDLVQYLRWRRRQRRAR